MKNGLSIKSWRDSLFAHQTDISKYAGLQFHAGFFFVCYLRKLLKN